MSEKPLNVRGLFPVTVYGIQKEYQAKCNYSVIEHLENRALTRTLFEVLFDAMNMRFKLSEITEVMHAAITAGNDGKPPFSKSELGDMIHADGQDKYYEWYLVYLTYSVTGKTEVKAEPVTQDEADKKKETVDTP